MNTLTVALTIVVRFYDMAGVSPREAAHAQQAVTAALSGADIHVSWVSCGQAPTGQGAALEMRAPALETKNARCDSPTASDLIVRAVRGPAGLASAALGDAVVDSNASVNSLATIYVERIRALAAAAGTDSGILMGRAIAHEIGHLVSGTSEHAVSGLMRAHWSETALRRDSPRAWTFSNGESEILRVKVRQRTAPPPEAADASNGLALVEWPPNPRPCAAGPTCGGNHPVRP